MFKPATGNSVTKFVSESIIGCFNILYFRSVWPLAGLICFGAGLFFIATVIVLALIPLYISEKDVAAVDSEIIFKKNRSRFN